MRFTKRGTPSFKLVMEGSNHKSLFSLIQYGYILLLLTLPFSVEMSLGGFNLNVPSEPLLLILSLILGFWFYHNGFYGREIRRASISVTSLFWLAWLIVGIPFSAYPIVSIKYMLITILHWWVFYVGVFIVLRRLSEDFSKYLYYYAASFALVMIYAWYQHSQYQFSIDTSVLVARPFYFDHALSSACLLLLIGPMFVFGIQKIKSFPLAIQRFPVLLSLVFLVGIYLSFSRAAWLSMLLSGLILFIIFIFRIRFRGLMLLSGVGLCFLYFMLPSILQKAAQNTAESKTSGLVEQIISSGNISTDVSNLERINRYSCAWRMFLDRPVLGFGSGTYQFAYLPYQRKSEMTRISVSTIGPHGPGRGGGAHSEYLQQLSENGLPGFIFWIALILASIQTGLDVFYSHPKYKYLAFGILFSLLTYFIHAWFNNFLHHDKLAVLVWGLMAALTLMKLETEMPSK